MHRTDYRTDIEYAIAVLLAAGATVHTRGTRWAVTTKDGTQLEVSREAMTELAWDEARRRRDDWSHVADNLVQSRLF